MPEPETARSAGGSTARPPGHKNSGGHNVPGTPPRSSRLFETRPHPAQANTLGQSNFPALPQKAADARILPPDPLASGPGAPAPEAGTMPQSSGAAPPHAANEMPKQPPAQTAAATPGQQQQQPGRNETDHLSELKNHIAKSGNPLFIKDYYDEKTPQEEKLLLKKLLLSLKAPEGEKLPLPISNLQHWLNVENRPNAENEGPLEIPFENLAKFDVMKDGGKKILDYFGTHPDKNALEKKSMFDWLRSSHSATGGPAAVPDTHWDTLVSGLAPGLSGYFGLPRPGNEEFFYGLGGATLTGSSSGMKGHVDKNNAAKTQGNISYTLKDRYDWNKNQGTTIPITLEMIQKYLPKGVPVITPKNGTIQINDSFFHDLEKQGHGRSFDIQSRSPSYKYEFTQRSPGERPTYRVIPAEATAPLSFEGQGVLP